MKIIKGKDISETYRKALYEFGHGPQACHAEGWRHDADLFFCFLLYGSKYCDDVKAAGYQL